MFWLQKRALLKMVWIEPLFGLLIVLSLVFYQSIVKTEIFCFLLLQAEMITDYAVL